ncbi:MAG TPA: hypothetical protein ENN43_02235, partial [bacterium]|nr:hypothetical protein [bacterium]
MRKGIFAAVLILWIPLCCFAESGTEVKKYDFSFYMLIQSKSLKRAERPDFGYRLMKTFPLKVKEFTFPAPYLDYNARGFKEKTEEVILGHLSEARKKNAVRVADSI